MPRKDQTGPNGMGPMTGRKAGYCSNLTTPSDENKIGCRGMKRRSNRNQKQESRMGLGHGNGQGANRRGCRRQAAGRQFQFANGSFESAIPANNEASSLKNQVLDLQSQLETLLSKINRFENGK